MTIYESITFDPHKYMSFDTLTDDDLRDIARWGLTNDFDSSGAWDDANGDINIAVSYAVNGFERLLRDKFPNGFSGIPKSVPIYRLLKLKSINDFNKDHMGFSWFTDKDRVNDPDFTQQLMHLRGDSIYMISAITPLSNVDIPRSLFQRDMVYLENELVVKDDSNIKFISIDRIK